VCCVVVQPARGVFGFEAFGVEDEGVGFEVEWERLAADLPAHLRERWLGGLFVGLALVSV